MPEQLFTWLYIRAGLVKFGTIISSRHKQIKDTAEGSLVFFEELRSFAAVARHRREVSAFHIENFAQESARGVNFAHFTLVVPATATLIIWQIVHNFRQHFPAGLTNRQL